MTLLCRREREGGETATFRESDAVCYRDPDAVSWFADHELYVRAASASTRA